MSTTEPTLAELLNAARKTAAEKEEKEAFSPFIDDVEEENDLFLMDEDNFKMTEYVAGELAKYKPFRLTTKAEQIITEFLTFRLNIRKAGYSLPEANDACYNLIIRSEDLHRTTRLVQTLKESLLIPNKAFISHSEEEFIRMLGEAERFPNMIE